MKKYIVYAMAAMMLLSAIAAKAQIDDDISRDITEGKIQASEIAMGLRDSQETQQMRLDIKKILGQINSIADKLYARMGEQDIAIKVAKIGTEIDIANEMVRDIKGRHASEDEVSSVLNSLKLILKEVQAVNAQ